MLNVKILGITGPARSGKDTCANILQKHNYERYSFADPIREALKAMLNFTDRDLHFLKEEEHPDYGVSPRYMMQTLGTEWGRNLIHPHIWIITAHRHLERRHAENAPSGFVIPDVRFDNEADFIHEQNGHIIHLERSSAGLQSNHPSEAGVTFNDHLDYKLSNNSTIDDLEVNLKQILEAIYSL